MSASATIELMPLYTHLDRIERGLLTLGIGPDDPIQPERLFPLDQWHYHGTDAGRALLSFVIQPAGFSTLALALADQRGSWYIPSVVTSPHSNFNLV